MVFWSLHISYNNAYIPDKYILPGIYFTPGNVMGQ
jgi:hypothetical protein